MNAEAICDGRGNAGTGARAAILHILETGEVIERAEKIPATTNIVAEHLAIQLALEMAIDAGVRRLTIYNDSQVPVYQIQGKYGVKQEHLLPHVERAWELGASFDEVSIEWTPRENTEAADLLCRQVDVKPFARPRPLPPRERT